MKLGLFLSSFLIVLISISGCATKPSSSSDFSFDFARESVDLSTSKDPSSWTFEEPPAFFIKQDLTDADLILISRSYRAKARRPEGGASSVLAVAGFLGSAFCLGAINNAKNDNEADKWRDGAMAFSGLGVLGTLGSARFMDKKNKFLRWADIIDAYRFSRSNQ